MYTMDPLSAFSLVSSILIVLVTAVTMIFLAFDFRVKTEQANHDFFEAQQTAFSVLQCVLKECEHILDGPIDAPVHVLEALATCQTQGENYDHLSTILRHDFELSTTFSRTLKLVAKAPELSRLFAAYKGSVLLLRDLCSDRNEVRLGFVITKSPNNLALVHQANQLKVMKQVLKSGFGHLSAEKYNIDAAIQIIVDRPLAKHPGDAFKYYPARVKLDSASDVDLVSLSYLRQAGALEHIAPVEIPEETRLVLRGVGDGSLTPSHRVLLKWCGHGESKIHEGWFEVVDFPEIDILLGTASFAKIAVERVARAWPIFGRRKSKAISDREHAREEESLARARRNQIAELERKRVERRRDQLALGRAETIASDETSANQSTQGIDLELGNSGDRS
ncbi:hypothetical protein QBC40DRAFT_269261 [Triangularia verruculosa]|uniref:Uncharacterized protein n=1 Tax=Triangularia verruculosa TaxID=2587418 RepID=A0AAN7ARX7_9PEZI|nr:hypothetical protein QBC40DRAFT_269261 [Triangularia verruculosa]